jgi:hypothetical protein
MAVSQFNDQLAGTSAALTAQQQEQLVQAMSQARSDFKWTSDLNNKPDTSSANFAAIFSEDNINKFAQDKEQFDQQFLSQAQQILSPEQLAKFQDFQTSQRQLQIASMKMAAQMFGPKSQ